MARNISSVHADFAKRQIQWSRIRDALEGQDEIKENGEAYLKKPSAMTVSEYTAYKDRAQFFPVAERTLRGMSGLVFRHNTQFKLPPRLEELTECATTDGHSLTVMAEQVVNELLSIGRYGLLVDFPEATPNSTALPYIATYTAENILDWTSAFVEGKRQVVRIVVKDDFDNNDDANDVAEQRLELVINEDGVYEVRKWTSSTAVASSDKSATSFVLTSSTVPQIGGKPLKAIPFVFINPYDLRPEVEKPPMLDLVDVNVGHYRNSADYEHALYLTAQPTPWISGQLQESNKPTAIGSGAIWYLPEGAQAGMLEFQGAGIEAQRKAMEDKENRMAALGARMIHEGRARNEASDTAKMRGKSEMSLLTNVVNMAEAGILKALKIAAEWVGANPKEVEVRMNRDWVAVMMDSNTLNALVKAWQAGAISHDTLYSNLQRGEIASLERSFEDEKDMIEDEGGDLALGMNALMVQAAQQPPGKPGQQPGGQPAPGPGGAQPKPAALTGNQGDDK